jgi:hypothetical protein
VDADKALLSEVLGRLLRNKRILEQAKKRARKKALCLALELKAKGEAVNAELFNCPAALIRIEQSSIV